MSLFLNPFFDVATINLADKLKVHAPLWILLKTHTLNSYTHTKNTHLMKPDFLLRTNNTSILSFLSECFTKNKNKNTQKQQHPFSLLINDFNRSCHSQYSHSRSLPKLSSQDEEGGAGLGFPSGGPAHFEPIPHDHDFW